MYKNKSNQTLLLLSNYQQQNIDNLLIINIKEFLEVEHKKYIEEATHITKKAILLVLSKVEVTSIIEDVNTIQEVLSFLELNHSATLKINHSTQCPCLKLSEDKDKLNKFNLVNSNRNKSITPASVGLVVDRNNNFLLTRRNINLNVFPGKWVFPGGRVDPQESFFDTVIREIEEEVGIKLDECSNNINNNESFKENIGKESIRYKLNNCVNKSSDISDDITVEISPLNFYESVFPIYLEESEPKAQHIIVFYLLKINLDNVDIKLQIQESEVDAYAWFNLNDLKTMLDNLKNNGNEKCYVDEKEKSTDFNYNAFYYNKIEKNYKSILCKEDISNDISYGHRLAFYDAINILNLGNKII